MNLIKQVAVFSLLSFVSVLTFAGIIPSADWVQTPGGAVLRSQVHAIAPGEALVKRFNFWEIYEIGTGRVVAKIRVSGVVPRDKSVSDEGWVTYALANSGTSPIQSLTTVWTVPTAPSSQGSQLLYFFNGLMNSAKNIILQPVLQWGVSPAGGGAYWAVASWYVTSDGQAFHTNVIPVNPGQVLTGIMMMTGAGASTSEFNYTSYFAGISDTTLGVTDIEPLVLASETLEVYRVGKCSQYPASPIAFTGINIQAASINSSQVQWQSINELVDCEQNTAIQNNQSSSAEVDISYGN